MIAFQKMLCSLGLFILFCVPAAYAKGDTLIIASPMDAKTLDPHGTPESGSQNVNRQIYESLVTYDEKMDVVPWLAEKWEVSENGSAYTFYLKKGVKFHNGETMTADDVLFSFQRALGPDGGAVRALASYIDPKGLEVVDPHTIIVRTRQPMGSVFLASMFHPWSSILSRKAVESAGKDYGMNPVGTGRFKFASWAKGDNITLAAFDDYHGEKAKLKKMIFRAVVETNSRSIELESGAVDMSIDPQLTDLKRLMEKKDLKVVSMPGQVLYHLGLDITKAPYDNIKVREAMNLAVNRAGIVKAVFIGYGEVPTGPFPGAAKYSKIKETPAVKPDFEKAKKLLAEAGYPDGFKGAIITADRPVYINIATVAQENLKRIGIDMEIKVYEWGTYIDAMKVPGHEPYMYGWWGGAPALDPFFFLGPQFHSVAAGQTNLAFLKDSEIDALLDKGAQLMDGPERAAVYGELWDRLNKQLPWIYLATANRNTAMAKNLQGIFFTPSMINYYGNAYFGDK